MLTVTFYSNTTGKRVRVGVVTLEGGILTTKSEQPDYDDFFSKLTERPIVIQNGKEVFPDTPEEWIRGLAYEYRNLYLWATYAEGEL